MGRGTGEDALAVAPFKRSVSQMAMKIELKDRTQRAVKELLDYPDDPDSFGDLAEDIFEGAKDRAEEYWQGFKDDPAATAKKAAPALVFTLAQQILTFGPGLLSLKPSLALACIAGKAALTGFSIYRAKDAIQKGIRTIFSTVSSVQERRQVRKKIAQHYHNNSTGIGYIDPNGKSFSYQ